MIITLIVLKKKFVFLQDAFQILLKRVEECEAKIQWRTRETEKLNSIQPQQLFFLFGFSKIPISRCQRQDFFVYSTSSLEAAGQNSPFETSQENRASKNQDRTYCELWDKIFTKVFKMHKHFTFGSVNGLKC